MILYIKEIKIFPVIFQKLTLIAKNKQFFQWSQIMKKRTDNILQKNLSVLLKGVTSKHDDDFYYLNCLHSSRTDFKSHELKSHEIRKNKDISGILMPYQKDNIMKLNQYIKSDKMPYII